VRGPRLGVWGSWPGADRNAAVQVAGGRRWRAAPSGPSRVGNNIAIVWFVRRPHPLGQFAPFESGCFLWSVVALVYRVFACRLGLSVKKYQAVRVRGNVCAAGRITGINASPACSVTCLLHLLSSCTSKQRPRYAVGGILRQALPAVLRMRLKSNGSNCFTSYHMCGKGMHKKSMTGSGTESSWPFGECYNTQMRNQMQTNCSVAVDDTLQTRSLLLSQTEP